MKALHLALGQEGRGHIVARLLRELPMEVPSELVDMGRVLDNFYIPTRYAHGHPEGPPFEHYGQVQSAEAIRCASAILELVRSRMA